MDFRVVQPTDPPHLKAAFSVLGLSEIEGPKHSKQIVEMYRAAGHPEVKDDETPWCAAFVNWSLAQAGVKGTGSLMARSFVTYGRGLERTKPVPRGAIAVWPRGAPPSGHVNIVLHDDGTYVWTIDGNVSNRVTIVKWRKSQALCYRLPPLPLSPPDVEPVPVPWPRPPAQDTEVDVPEPVPQPQDVSVPWWKRPFVWLGGMLSGGLLGGNLSVDAQFLWGLNATILLVAALFVLWVYGFKPRGKFFKGVFDARRS